MDAMNSNDSVIAGLVGRNDAPEAMMVHGRYRAECFGADGNLKWVEEFDNLVTTVGKNDILDKYLAGSSYTPSLFLGLKGTGTAAAGDTQASHSGWSEVGGTNAPAFTGNRPVPAFSAAASGTKTMSSAASFAFTSSGTVAGCFLNNGGSATKDNTTGILVSNGDFSSSRSVVNGDTLNVTYSLSA